MEAWAGPAPDGGDTPPAAENDDPAPPSDSPPPPSERPTVTSPPSPSTAGGTSEPGDGGGGQKAPPQDLSETWNYNRRGAARPRYIRSTEDPILFAPNPIGFYSGVSVEGNQVPPNPAPKLGTKPALLTWTGFERTDSGSQVFFQLSGDATYTTKRRGNIITIRLRRTKVNVRNNKRPLDLRFFKTPVQSVRVRRRGKDTEARIVLKRSSEPSISMVDDSSGSGYKMLVVRFAEGAKTEPN
jgi:hypothetical protein